MKRIAGIVTFVSLLAVWSVWPMRLAAQPAVSHATPGAVQPGATTELVLHGSKFQTPLQLWSSVPATFELAGDDAVQDAAVRYRVTLGADASVGIAALVIATPAGLSDPLLLMVDDLSSVADNGSNHAPEAAQEITLPVAVDGGSNGTSFDYYRFAGHAGQPVTVEVVAARLGSKMDPVIRLLNEKGQELAYADDDTALGADCRVRVTLPADGNYVVEVRDNQYDAGGRYRLRLGDFPLLTVPYPLGARRGSTARFEFLGADVAGVAPHFLHVPEQAGRLLPVGVKNAGGQGSALATLAVSDLPEAVEREPNNELAAATPITLPTGVSGRLQEAGDHDCFEFAAVKGQQLELQAWTRSLAAPGYVILSLLDEAGKTLAESPPGDNDEPLLRFTVPADGLYRLRVEELLRRGGPGFAYRVELRETVGASVALKGDSKTQFAVPLDGGATTIPVQVERHGDDGPLTVRIEGDSPWQLLNNVIPAGAKEAQLLLVAPSSSGPQATTPGRLDVVRLVARGSQGDVPLSTTALLRARWPQLAYPPESLDGLLAFSTVAAADPLFAVAAPEHIPFVSEAQQGQAALKLERKNGEFKDPLVVHVDQLPAGVTAEVKKQGEGENEQYVLALKGVTSQHSGSTLRVVGYGAAQGRGQVQTLALPLKAVPALHLSVETASSATIGDMHKVKIKVARAAFLPPQPVTITWKDLPAGIAAPEPKTLAADQNELELALNVTGDAAAGETTAFTVQATTKVGEQDVTVENSSVKLQLQKAEAKPAEPKPAEPKPAEPKPAEPKPAEASPDNAPAKATSTNDQPASPAPESAPEAASPNATQ